MTRVLFICHGNICRSPMAEFMMRDLVEKAGLFRVARHVLAPDPEAFITEPVIPAPVSYTHLDVYKRQALIVLFRMDNRLRFPLLTAKQDLTGFSSGTL